MTSKSTWKSAEREVATFINPLDGRRTPLSGINSGVTHADCMNVGNLFVEVKYRKSFALWTLYSDTASLAKKESKVPIVVIKEKSKSGFIFLIKNNFIDTFVQSYIKSRDIHVSGNDEATVGNTVLKKIFSGSPTQISFLKKHLRSNSFKKDGTLRYRWWESSGELLSIKLVLDEGLQIALYGTFAHQFNVSLSVLPEDITEALRASPDD